VEVMCSRSVDRLISFFGSRRRVGEDEKDTLGHCHPLLVQWNHASLPERWLRNLMMTHEKVEGSDGSKNGESDRSRNNWRRLRLWS
jgi:hypothetical protein